MSHDKNVLPEIAKQANLALVLGILSIVICGPLGIAAILSANRAQRLIATSGVGEAEQSKAVIGKVLGILGLLGMLLAILLGGLFMAATFRELEVPSP